MVLNQSSGVDWHLSDSVKQLSESKRQVIRVEEYHRIYEDNYCRNFDGTESQDN